MKTKKIYMVYYISVVKVESCETLQFDREFHVKGIYDSLDEAIKAKNSNGVYKIMAFDIDNDAEIHLESMLKTNITVTMPKMPEIPDEKRAEILSKHFAIVERHKIVSVKHGK